MLLSSVLSFFLFFNSASSLPDSAGYRKINEIKLTGNKTTKDFIIYRELDFKSADSIPFSDLKLRLEKSRQNLINTSLFNFVTINPVYIDSFRTDIYIDVIERWYIFPFPIFELADRNFNVWWQTKDFGRTNYGFYLVKENFRGRKERIRAIFRTGYTRQWAFAYDIPYLTKNQRSGMGVYAGYSRNHEIPYKTFGNQLLFYKNENIYVREEFATRLKYTNRQGIYNSHTIEGRYNQANVADTIRYLNEDYFINRNTSTQFLSLSYIFRSDHRVSRAYPLQGYYFDLELTQTGFGILKKENIDVFKMEASIRKYWKLSNRFYTYTGLKGKYSTKNNQPYYLLRGLGYGDLVRGYEYYVVDGQHYGLLKTGFKYELVKPQKAKIDFIPGEKFNTFHYAFYLELFADGAFVQDYEKKPYNPLSNNYLFGTGLGLHYVTYYDKVIRLEYSMNRMKERGIFINFSAPF